MKTDPDTPRQDPGAEEDAAPPCVLCFNAAEPTGAAGTGADVAAVAAMGAHPLLVTTALLVRDTAEVFDQHVIDSEVVVEQARSVLEDVPTHAMKVGFLGSAESVSAVAEVLSDYPDVPLVTHLTALPWLDDEQQSSYHDALRELVLPQTTVLVGSHQVLTEFLLPEWDGSRPASPRELAVEANRLGAAHVLVTSIQLPNNFVDNVLAGPQGPITGEKFERIEAGFVGAGDTLSAALAALLAVGVELHEAVGEALAFLDQSLDAGFQLGMGLVVPDRFFWALPNDEPAEGEEEQAASPDTPPHPRRMH
ncbi:hydroxymethylpyrimidine/phosphomethylpyrimidine kinase [Inhella sp.]|uniref:bifunctional hydroxymethylpyrimidine kinase/phosphomethylpyrimidine kinase n=1 Tax=Inhella sp. TaxID=1921806 RepID=UPI0035B45032